MSDPQCAEIARSLHFIAKMVAACAVLLTLLWLARRPK